MRFLALFLLLFAPLLAEEEIVVHLASEAELAPLYLDSIEGGTDQSYVQALEEVLRFDLAHNGKTQMLSKGGDCAAQSKREKGWRVFDKGAWQNLHVAYVVKVVLHDKKLSASAYTVEKGTFKGLEGVALTGNLQEDRRTMHEVADAIYTALFGGRGIAHSKILYTVRKRCGANATDWQTDVWEADYDGKNARQITHDGFLAVTPYYAGHHHFLYVSYKIGQPKILIASTHDGAGKRLTLMRGNQLMPALSPKKDCMAFVSDITGNPELFIQPFSIEKGLLDKPRQVFAAKGGAQGSPTFSPDGRRLAFVSNKDGAPRIYIIDIPVPGAPIKEVKAHLITKLNRDNTCPAWSPDGTKIAYSSITRGTRQIWIYDFKTKRETQLTSGKGHKENPAWGPDSLHLLFNSGDDNKSEIYLISLTEKEAVQITTGPGEKRFPAWEA